MHVMKVFEMVLNSIRHLLKLISSLPLVNTRKQSMFLKIIGLVY